MQGPVPKAQKWRFCTNPASLTPGPVPKPKNDDSVQARPLNMSRFGSPERRPKDTAPPRQRPGQQSAAHTTHATRPTPRPHANPNGTELTTHPRDDRDDKRQTKRTWVQPPDPQTINGNPSLRIREKGQSLGQPLYKDKEDT